MLQTRTSAWQQSFLLTGLPLGLCPEAHVTLLKQLAVLFLHVVNCIAVRALKMHGGGPAVTAGRPLDHAYTNEDVALVKAGCCNLARHISNTRKYGVPVVVAINKFATDADAELQAVKEAALEAGKLPATVLIISRGDMKCQYLPCVAIQATGPVPHSVVICILTR